MLLSLRKSLRDFFVFTNGYSALNFVPEENVFMPSWSMDLIRSLVHEGFKELCAGYFEEKCYRAKLNTQHDKKLANIWLFKESYSSIKPFGMIKCWGTKAISVDSNNLNEFSKIIAKNNIPLGVFITAGKFSTQANKNITKKLKLVDGVKLLTLIEALPEVRKQRLLVKLTQST